MRAEKREKFIQKSLKTTQIKKKIRFEFTKIIPNILVLLLLRPFRAVVAAYIVEKGKKEEEKSMLVKICITVKSLLLYICLYIIEIFVARLIF